MSKRQIEIKEGNRFKLSHTPNILPEEVGSVLLSSRRIDTPTTPPSGVWYSGEAVRQNEVLGAGGNRRAR